MDLKIIEKPLVFQLFICFFNISRYSVETLKDALRMPWELPSGGLGDSLECLGDAPVRRPGAPAHQRNAGGSGRRAGAPPHRWKWTGPAIDGGVGAIYKGPLKGRLNGPFKQAYKFKPHGETSNGPNIARITPIRTNI